MKTIWKFELSLEDPTVFLPTGAKILTAQSQNNNICVWAEVDVGAVYEEVVFQVFVTGQQMFQDVDREYVGTVQLHDGGLVYHVHKVARV